MNLVSDGLQSVFMDSLACNILNDLHLLVSFLCKSEGSNVILLCVIKQACAAEMAVRYAALSVSL